MESSNVITVQASETTIATEEKAKPMSAKELANIVELQNITKLLCQLPEDHWKYVKNAVNSFRRGTGETVEASEESPEMVNTAKLFALKLGSVAQVRFSDGQTSVYEVTSRDSVRGPGGFTALILTDTLSEDNITRELHSEKDASIVSADVGEKGKPGFRPGLKVITRVI